VTIAVTLRIDLDFLYALGYPIGVLAVLSMPPMAVLVFWFVLAVVNSVRVGVGPAV
jgi:hypothetical protein